MKTSIFTIIAASIVTLSSSAFASTSLPAIGSFNKMEVHGNVKVVVANGDKNAVEVSNDYYAENAVVQNANGKLRIASYSKDTLVVYVTANDLRSIEVFDNATIKSDGKLSAIQLEVSLHNNAYAALNLDNFSANVTIEDSAKADLTGDVTELAFNHSLNAIINQKALVADIRAEKVIMPVVLRTAAAQNTSDDLAMITD